MQYQIITTCGTSFLTNPAKGNKELQKILTKWTNYKDEVGHDEVETIQIDQHYEFLLEREIKLDVIKNDSAELNCFLSWFDNQNLNPYDCIIHLLHTDTYLGTLSAMLVENQFKQIGFNQIYLEKIDNLNTEDIDSFEIGLSNFAKWAFENVVKNDNEKFIFNVAGGFKSFSGFAQILGQFLADETIYIFEDRSKVLSMPQMPIKVVETEAIKAKLNDYRCIALNLPLSNYDHLNKMWVKNGHFTPWGQIIWESAKREIYEEKIYKFITDKISFGKEFDKSIECIANDKLHIKQVNERIDDLCLYAENHTINPRRLDYKSIKGEVGKLYKKECDAWSDGRAMRLYCNEDGDKIIIEKLADSLH